MNGYSPKVKIYLFATGEQCLTAVRSRSRENNTQLFSNTLAPLRYPDGYAQMRIPPLAVSCQARNLNYPQIKNGTITANYTPSGNTQDVRHRVRIHFLCGKQKGHPQGVSLLFGAEGVVFTKGEDTHTLRLTSELVDLRVEYANPRSLREQCSAPTDCENK